MIVFCDHARKRMSHYQVKQDVIADILDHPDIRFPGWEGRTMVRGRTKGRDLTVTYEDYGNGDTLVITVYPNEGDPRCE